MTNDNPVAVVTGASRGIGRALAIRLATDGFDVAGTWNRDAKAADETTSLIEDLGRRCRMYRSDVSDPAATASLVEQVASDFGQVDAVVHNAGIASRGRFVSDTEPSEIQHVLAVHALGAFYLCSGLTPVVRKSTRGSIVLISSVATSNPSPGGAPYMMGKDALEALAQTLGLEERTHGTRVNVVAPGLVATEMGDRLARALTGRTTPRASTPRCRSVGCPPRGRRRPGVVPRLGCGRTGDRSAHRDPRRKARSHSLRASLVRVTGQATSGDAHSAESTVPLVRTGAPVRRGASSVIVPGPARQAR